MAIFGDRVYPDQPANLGPMSSEVIDGPLPHHRTPVGQGEILWKIGKEELIEGWTFWLAWSLMSMEMCAADQVLRWLLGFCQA